ncbi:MAG: ABC transporter ATP-binding protein [Deltaproteobacteria bacterium]|nr:ABC transporter ATP-binding protein [Deltaproteobacteria bacterium]
MPTPAIEIKDLTKKYGDFIVVNKISFRIIQGDIFGFLGHNGAGKTTTVNMLTTLLKPTEGHAMIDGFDIIKEPMEVQKRIGYVPENVQLYETLTAYENLDFFARLSGLKKPGKIIYDTLHFLGAVPYAHNKIKKLSKGMRQRIGLAQAILHKPKVLFLDEPSSGLDPMGIKQLRDICIRLNKETNMTIFMNTHLLSEVTKTCKTIGVLNHGNLIYMDSLESTLNRFKDENSLEQIYLSMETDNQYD